MEKVRIGNDMRVNFSVYRNGQPESFDGASNIVTKLVNEAYNKEITHTYTIAGNVVQFDIDALQLAQCGKCRLFISYTKGGDYTVDSPAFELVNYTGQTGGTEIIGVEIVSINISGDIGINRDGLSAYEVWEAYPGNEGKTIEEYFLWLRENPTKIDLDGLNSNIDKLHFNPDTLVQLANIGDVRYSQESKTLEVKVSDTVSIQLGQEMQTRVKNDEAIQINNGQMVYINSAAGANPLAKIASTSNTDVAQKTFGMATENIPANGFGAITTEGLVRDINTSAFPEGAMLWLGTNGSVTNIEPTAPTSKISVGMVLRSNANNGVVYVKIRTIARNQKLSDVYAPTLTGGDILRWNSTTLRFEVYNINTALTLKTDTSRKIIAGLGLIGGGDFTTDKTIDVVSANDGITVNTDNIQLNTVDNLTTASPTKPLSANQGKVLNEKAVQLETDLNYMYPSVGIAKRVLSDSGTIKSRSTLNELTNKFLDLLPNTKLLFCPQLAVKLRESGVYKYVTKLYDVGPAMLDGAQTTALNQPYLSGNIAPNEKYALKNPNRGNTFLSHTPISFTNADKWSVSTILNCNGGATDSYMYYAGQTTYGFASQSGNVILLRFANAVNSCDYVTKKHVAKSTIITWVSEGSGILVLYINGILAQTYTGIDSSYIESELGRGRNPTYYNFGAIYYHCIRDIALTTTQVADEYTYLRSIFPEIESVQIGTQTWATSNCEMVCTPQGNVIQEMQAATNVEKVVNGSFDTDSNWNKGTSWSINGGKALCAGSTYADSLSQSTCIGYVGKSYKCSINVILTSGTLRFYIGGVYYIVSSSGVYDFYLVPTIQKNIEIVSYNFVGSIDDVSSQEVGWADSTNLYNYVYANTTGTAEQKEYAAVKAAAMWCYYNNDPAIGAVYGKLYNWYAVRLLQMDIDYYNAANPTTPWGWRVPSSADFATLSTYLGGDAIAGGKMKKEGLSYWNTPNTGADNLSGFSAISGGLRTPEGTFALIGLSGYKYTLDAYYKLLRNSDTQLISSTTIKIYGLSLRLIKL